ncbi:MAG: hypothetical protein L3K23_02930 [Thermoplasmata archaeon]|nr:hypothetical protein [Thermoplasmata archaeon]
MEAKEGCASWGNGVAPGPAPRAAALWAAASSIEARDELWGVAAAAGRRGVA